MKQLGELFLNQGNPIYKEDPTYVLPKTSIGIEVEVENIRHTMTQGPRGNLDYIINNLWACVSDGSLRNHGAEFVSRVVWGTGIAEALHSLQDYLAEREAPKYSTRCSTHIHLDVRDLTIQQLQMLVQLYLIFEIPLFKMSGSRLNCEYCLPYYQSPDALYALADLTAPQHKTYKIMANPEQYKVSVDALRQHVTKDLNKYMALNILPFSDKGSIEFRHHCGTHNKQELTRWINTIMCLKLAAQAREYDEDPFIIFSKFGALRFLESIFEPDGVINSIYYEGIEEDLWVGCRAAQEVRHGFEINQVNRKLITPELIDNYNEMFGDGGKNPKIKKFKPLFDNVEVRIGPAEHMDEPPALNIYDPRRNARFEINDGEDV